MWQAERDETGVMSRDLSQVADMEEARGPAMAAYEKAKAYYGGWAGVWAGRKNAVWGPEQKQSGSGGEGEGCSDNGIVWVGGNHAYLCMQNMLNDLTQLMGHMWVLI